MDTRVLEHIERMAKLYENLVDKLTIVYFKIEKLEKKVESLEYYDLEKVRQDIHNIVFELKKVTGTNKS